MLSSAIKKRESQILQYFMKKINLKVLVVIISIIPCKVYSQQKFSSLLPRGIENLNIKSQDTSFIRIATRSNISGEKILKVNSFLSKRSTYAVQADIGTTVNKGDVLWLSFRGRSLASKRETGEALIQVSMDRKVNGKYEWPPLLERGISFGPRWNLIQIPFIASKAVGAGDLSLVIKGGDVPQSFEIDSLVLYNYTQNLTIKELPKSVIRYDGDDPKASWRKEAAERIEKMRKGDLTVKVIDSKGRPISSAKIGIRMKRLDFTWGTATNSRILLDTVNANAKIYRDTLLKYFNKIVFENELKSANWRKQDHQKTLTALSWLKKLNLPVRGHVMFWPSWEHSAHLSRFKNDTTGLRETVLALIREQTKVMRGQFVEWDVINEPYAHHDILDLLGRHFMIDCFQEAKKDAPEVKLFLNDYTMFQGSGTGSASQAFYDNVKYLQNNGAPIQGIGEQGHIGGTPPGIPYIISRLDYFAGFHLPIQITEFDITSDDDDFKSSYIKDFMTAIFSHPATIGVMQWGFWEGQHWIPAAALWDKNWKLKPEGQAFADLITKTWRTDADLFTDHNGISKIRAFNGIYDISVQTGNQRVNRQLSVTSRGEVLTITLK